MEAERDFTWPGLKCFVKLRVEEPDLALAASAEQFNEQALTSFNLKRGGLNAGDGFLHREQVRRGL
jgi:hypothetical protein